MLMSLSYTTAQTSLPTSELRPSARSGITHGILSTRSWDGTGPLQQLFIAVCRPLASVRQVLLLPLPSHLSGMQFGANQPSSFVRPVVTVIVFPGFAAK